MSDGRIDTKQYPHFRRTGKVARAEEMIIDDTAEDDLLRKRGIADGQIRKILQNEYDKITNKVVAGNIAGKTPQEMFADYQLSKQSLIDKVKDYDPTTVYYIKQLLDGTADYSSLLTAVGRMIGADMASVAYDSSRTQVLRSLNLDAYKSTIDGYIEQSRNLMNNLPPRTRQIIEKLKLEQSDAYRNLKNTAAKGKKIITEAKEMTVAYSTGVLIPDLQQGANVVPNPSCLVIKGFLRSFYVKIPSKLYGVPYDLIYGIGNFVGDNLQITKKYMHIRNIQRRQYNFKFKAWWGPMTSILKDSQMAFGSNSVPFLMLRISATQELVTGVKDGGFASLYTFEDSNDYRTYCKQLIDTRTLNFKVKSTAQRFVKNNMAKFLNTDRRIVNEINNYTQA